MRSIEDRFVSSAIALGLGLVAAQVSTPLLTVAGADPATWFTLNIAFTLALVVGGLVFAPIKYPDYGAGGRK